MSEYDYPETRTQHRKQRLNDVDHGFPFKKDQCMPPVPVVPPQPWSKQWIVPSVIPPGYPKDTTWVYNSSGRPQPAAPEQYSVGNPPVVRLKEQSRNPGGSTSRSQFDQAIARCGPETTPFSRECTPLSRAKPNNSHDPRRSRSSSHSRSNQVAPFLDAIISPVPPIPKNPSRQQKLFPIPTVLPPGYPEDSRLLTSIKNVMSLTESTQSPAIAFQSTQKPIFKRIFGGIIGSSKRAKTPGPKQPPPHSHLSNSSQWSFQTNPRARTKSI
ncbi:hypothetical protein DL96DRAFT_1685603 [Flagelloscypha sp. PMI_526]|nr:hypothetical protein DL96DRAFT_1685603 [Flagelloscypha sp. PMI_526]